MSITYGYLNLKLLSKPFLADHAVKHWGSEFVGEWFTLARP